MVGSDGKTVDKYIDLLEKAPRPISGVPPSNRKSTSSNNTKEVRGRHSSSNGKETNRCGFPHVHYQLSRRFDRGRFT